MNNLFYDLPEDLQLKIIKFNPHPVVKLFDDFYSKFNNEVNKRITTITRKQRKLWSRIYYNYELNYYSMTPYRLYKKLITYRNNHIDTDFDFESTYERK